MERCARVEVWRKLGDHAVVEFSPVGGNFHVVAAGRLRGCALVEVGRCARVEVWRKLEDRRSAGILGQVCSERLRPG